MCDALIVYKHSLIGQNFTELSMGDMLMFQEVPFALVPQDTDNGAIFIIVVVVTIITISHSLFLWNLIQFQIISWSLQGGHLHTLFGTPSKINDRWLQWYKRFHRGIFFNFHVNNVILLLLIYTTFFPLPDFSWVVHCLFVALTLRGLVRGVEVRLFCFENSTKQLLVNKKNTVEGYFSFADQKWRTMT